MADITIYQKPTCTTCREVNKALADKGVDFNAVNYFVEPLTKAKLTELLKKMDMKAEGLLRKNEPIYQKLGIAKKKLSEIELVDLMVKYPDLIQRPIVEKGPRAVLARPAERLKEIL